MKADEILAMFQEEKRKEEVARIEKYGKIVEDYIEKHPGGHPTIPITDLDEYIDFIKARRCLEEIAAERKKKAETDGLISLLKGLTLDEESEENGEQHD